MSSGNMSDNGGIVAAGFPFSFCDFSKNPEGVPIIYYIYCLLLFIIWTVLVIFGYNRMSTLETFVRGAFPHLVRSVSGRNGRPQNP
jgi:hypothetical protein